MKEAHTVFIPDNGANDATGVCGLDKVLRGTQPNSTARNHHQREKNKARRSKTLPSSPPQNSFPFKRYYSRACSRANFNPV